MPVVQVKKPVAAPAPVAKPVASASGNHILKSMSYTEALSMALQAPLKILPQTSDPVNVSARANGFTAVFWIVVAGVAGMEIGARKNWSPSLAMGWF